MPDTLHIEVLIVGGGMGSYVRGSRLGQLGIEHTLAGHQRLGVASHHGGVSRR